MLSILLSAVLFAVSLAACSPREEAGKVLAESAAPAGDGPPERGV